MSFPEPKTIPEYQAQLLRAWGAVLRCEDQARALLVELKEMKVQVNLAVERAEKLVKVIESVKTT